MTVYSVKFFSASSLIVKTVTEIILHHSEYIKCKLKRRKIKREERHQIFLNTGKVHKWWETAVGHKGCGLDPDILFQGSFCLEPHTSAGKLPCSEKQESQYLISHLG